MQHLPRDAWSNQARGDGLGLPCPSVFTDHRAERAISDHFWSRILKRAGSSQNREAGKRRKGTTGYDTVSATPHACSPEDRMETEGIPPRYKQPDSNLPLSTGTAELSDLLICGMEQGSAVFLLYLYCLGGSQRALP